MLRRTKINLKVLNYPSNSQLLLNTENKEQSAFLLCYAGTFGWPDIQRFFERKSCICFSSLLVNRTMRRILVEIQLLLKQEWDVELLVFDRLVNSIVLEVHGAISKLVFLNSPLVAITNLVEVGRRAYVSYQFFLCLMYFDALL